MKTIKVLETCASSSIGNSLTGVASVVLGVAVLLGGTFAAQATTTADQARSSGVWQVESGQWLGRIIARLESDASKRAALMETIVFLNPEAFVNGDPNRMLAGAELKLPAAEAVDRRVSSVAKSVGSADPVIKAQSIGRVTGLRGLLTATGVDGSSRVLRRRSYIRQGDTLTTDIKGGAQVRFNDGAQIALRRDSSLRIDEYRWQGREDGQEKAILNLVKGGFRTITGAIGKVNKANYRVSTPFATIGIRGTHYALMSCAAGSCADLPGGGSDDGLIGGTASGAILVDDTHEIGAQQYFRHDGQSFQALMGPPAFLFAADTQVGDSNEQDGAAGDAGSSADGGDQSESDGGEGFAATGATESGALLGSLGSETPSQQEDSAFTVGEAVVSEAAEAGGAFDVAGLDLLGDLSNLSGSLTELYESLGATNIQVFDTAASNGVAYVAQVLPFNGLFEAADGVVDTFANGSFFITGSIDGKDHVLLGGLEIDGEDIEFFSGPPGSVLANTSASNSGGDFVAFLGRWDANALTLFFEPSEGETAQGIDEPLATEFVHSADRTPSNTLATLSALGTKTFFSLTGLGSDEQGIGFVLNPAALQFVVDFSAQKITSGQFNVTDGQGRSWSLFGSGLNVNLENDAELILSSGSCIGCIGGSTSAEGFIFTTFLGPNAEGALGSFGAHSGLLSNDVLEAISGVYVADR